MLTKCRCCCCRPPLVFRENSCGERKEKRQTTGGERTQSEARTQGGMDIRTHGQAQARTETAKSTLDVCSLMNTAREKEMAGVGEVEGEGEQNS